MPIPPRIANTDLEIQVEPSPHAHDTSCCPIIEVQAAELGATRSKRKRLKRKPREKVRIQPSFWRPTPEMGGKSVGYAWGYASSDPLPSDQREGVRYQRDTMRKAVLA